MATPKTESLVDTFSTYAAAAEKEVATLRHTLEEVQGRLDVATAKWRVWKDALALAKDAAAPPPK